MNARFLHCVVGTVAIASFVRIAVAAAPHGATPQDQAPKVFKSSVDVVTVDVNVVDRNGRPISDLAAGDFSLKVDSQPRRIVSAQFVRAGAAEQPEAVKAAVPYYSSNRTAVTGRLIAIVV